MKKRTWLAPGILLVVIWGLYLYPTPRKSFDELYAKVDADTVASLADFRQAHPVRALDLHGVTWEYLSLGEGPETILFLHGMTGAYDIWWQQMEALKDVYRVISVTYPAVDSLGEMEQAVMAILDAEGVEQFHVVGSSLGGYFAQYLVARHPDKILSAVFANTFPPNDILAEENKTIGVLLPYLPEWLVMNVLSGSIRESVYPASGYSELVLAFGLEQTHGRMSKAQVLGRFRCVVEPFAAPDVAALDVPVMIIEADNDPLVEKALRKQLKAAYPSAVLQTLSNVGHFPYLSVAEAYTQVLLAFLAAP
ncbi:MAG: alpha/beta hydrolase [Anaerolineales bacterium]|nr:alpha/beta hydrolase [Anaerolineales bacterium]